MNIRKEFSDNEFYLYMNGKLVYKKWFDLGYSKVFDRFPWSKHTEFSYTDLDVENSMNIITVKAKVRFKTLLEGGRNKGILSGYRCDQVFEYDENGKVYQTFTADFSFGDFPELELGKTYEVNVRFPNAQRVERFMEKGRKWWIHEGSILVGEGEMLDIEIPQIEK